MIDWRNQKVLVAGLGRTGISMLEFLTQAGADVAIYDAQPDAEQLRSLTERHQVAVYTAT